MSVGLTVALAAAGLTLVLLAVLGSVWLRNYRQHGANNTLGPLVFTLFVVQNAPWFTFYQFHPAFIEWFVNVGTDVQIGNDASLRVGNGRARGSVPHHVALRRPRRGHRTVWNNLG